MRKTVLMLVMITIVTISSGQESIQDNPKPIRNSIGLTLGNGDPWIGLYYEKILLPNWGMEFAVGLIGGSVGTKVYFMKVERQKHLLYTGLSEGILLLIGGRHYIPLGYSYIWNNGFRFNVDAGPQIFHDSKDGIMPGVNLRFGKAF